MIVDTGIRFTKEIKKYLCKENYDATGYGIEDKHGHGTHIASIIAKNVNPKKQCLYIIKFYHKDSSQNLDYTAAISHAILLKNVKYVNLSLGARYPSTIEKLSIGFLLEKNIHVSVAAGNDRLDLDAKCDVFPACYDFKSKYFHVVGSPTGPYSNIGKVVTDWIDGTKVKTWAGTMSGTSQSTAKKTAELIKSGIKD